MKNIFRLTLAILIVSILLVLNMSTHIFANSISNNTEDNISNEKKSEVIIMYKQNSSQFETKRKSNNLPAFLQGLTVEDTIKFNKTEKNTMKTKLAKSTTPTTSTTNDDLTISLVKSDKYSADELVRMLSKEESVVYAEKNYKVKSASITNDSYQKYQWAIENVGQNKGKKGSDINPEAINNQTSDEKVIAVLDTGVDYTHPDLKNRIWNNPYEQSGLLEGKHGFDFCDYDEDPMDENGHGTHVSGIIAAEANNNIGITGAVLDKSNIKIMPVRFLDAWGSGYLFDAINAYNYIYTAQQLGTNIVAINNSWGGIISKDDYILKTVINLVGKGPKNDGNGALSICAAGNEKINTDDYTYSPAGLDSNYIISVAACNEKDELLSFSNYGKYSVDIVAPGADILSTVAYNCFNPSIYDKNQKQKICSQYESFDSGLGNFKYNASEGTVTTSSESYFGTSGKSLKWNFNASKDNFYFLAIKYNGNEPNQYFSTMTKAVSNLENIGFYNYIYLEDDYDKINFEDLIQDDDSEEYEEDYDEYKNKISKTKISKKNIIEDENSWTHSSDIVNVWTEGRKAKSIVLFYYAPEDSNVSLYLDDFAISNSSCNEDEFGKYEFYSGTSMATPYVTAAVGVASNIKNETTMDRKARVLGATRQLNSLKDKAITNGILDYRYLTDPNPTIESAKIDNSGKITICIKNITDDAEILINNKKVEAKQNGNDQFILTDKSLKNTTVTISLKYAGNLISNKFFLASGKKFNDEPDAMSIGDIKNVFTDGKNLFVYSNQTIYKGEYDKQSGMYFEQIKVALDESVGNLTEEDALDEFTSINETSDFVIINEKIYTIVEVDNFFEQNFILAYYDLKSEDSGWRKLTELPDDCKNYMPTFGAYNGNLYVIGGYDQYEDMISKKMYEYNIKTKKWTKKANLPEERFAAKANQVGDKFIISFGGNKDGTVPCNLIYDGKKWKKSTASIDVKGGMEFYFDKKYYKPSVGIVARGLIYSGINAEKLGNTFYYDVDTDTFKSSGYMVDDDIDNTIGVAIRDKYYLLNKYSVEDGLSIKTIPVKSGLSKLTIRYPATGIRAWVNADIYNKTKGNGVIYNSYYYMPGDVIGLKLTDLPGYYYNHFKVDNKEINGYLYNGNIGTNKEIKITMAEVSSLITLDKTSAEVTSFDTLKLNAKVNTKNATDVKWKSSNTSYATVSSTGVVTPKWAGNGKVVTIMASTTVNGRNISLECKIRIKIPKIQNLRTTRVTNSSISLIWNAIKGAEGYEIYQYNYTTKKYELIKTLKGNSTTISNLKPSTMYNFQVLAFKTKDNKKCSTMRAAITSTTIQ